MPDTEVKKRAVHKIAIKKGTAKSSVMAEKEAVMGKHIMKEAEGTGGTEESQLVVRFFKDKGCTFDVESMPSFLFCNRSAQRELVKEGIPVSSIEMLIEALDISKKAISETLNITERTIGRRRTTAKFNLEESEKVLRLMSLLRMAYELFGEKEIVQDWFKEPNGALGGKTPLEYADTEPGAREVEDLLGRLAHGVFS